MHFQIGLVKEDQFICISIYLIF